jgi:hypothetical protein
VALPAFFVFAVLYMLGLVVVALAWLVAAVCILVVRASRAVSREIEHHREQGKIPPAP